MILLIETISVSSANRYVIIQLITRTSFIKVVHPPKGVAEFGFGLSGNGLLGEAASQQTLRELVELVVAVDDFLVVLQAVGLSVGSRGWFHVVIETCCLLIYLRYFLALVELVIEDVLSPEFLYVL